jgi:hypothetical protein
MLAFVVEIGRHLEGAALGCALIATVGGYLGAWGEHRGRRSLVELFLGRSVRENDRNAAAEPAQRLSFSYPSA